MQSETNVPWPQQDKFGSSELHLEVTEPLEMRDAKQASLPLSDVIILDIAIIPSLHTLATVHQLKI